VPSPATSKTGFTAWRRPAGGPWEAIAAGRTLPDVAVKVLRVLHAEAGDGEGVVLKAGERPDPMPRRARPFQFFGGRAEPAK